MEPVVIIIVAFLSSIIGGLVAAIALYLYLRYPGWRRMEAILDEYIEIMRSRLKAGVEEAGRELLPEFKEQVRQGFKEGFADMLHGELIDQTSQTARTLAKSGVDIMETGLHLLTGRRLKEENRPKPGNS